MTATAIPAARGRAVDPDTLRVGDRVWHDRLGGPYEVVRTGSIVLRRASGRRRRQPAPTFPVAARELRERYTTIPADEPALDDAVVATDRVARRIMIWHAVATAADDLATVRAANGTAPADRGDWLDLVRARLADLADDDEVDADALVGLAADVQGLLEQIAHEAAR